MFPGFPIIGFGDSGGGPGDFLLLITRADFESDIFHLMMKLTILLLIVCYLNSFLVVNGATNSTSKQQRTPSLDDDRHDEGELASNGTARNRFGLFSGRGIWPFNLHGFRHRRHHQQHRSHHIMNYYNAREDTSRQAIQTSRPFFLDVFRSACNQQNTTSLVLFTKANTLDDGDSRVTRYTNLKLDNFGFDPQRETIVLIHGFRGCSLRDQSFITDIKDLILLNREANVFYVDWNHYSNTFNYMKSVRHMNHVARDIYEILSNYELAYPGFEKENIHVIGHSLGAHIAGQLGRLLKGNLEQITGLDPAGVELDEADTNMKLTVDDAKYVSAYHTNSKIYGTKLMVGDRDIFFNDGSDQPSCTSSVAVLRDSCSHKMATTYLSTFMGKCVMIAYRCQSYQGFMNGHCGFCRPDSHDCVAVGHEWQYNLGEDQGLDILRPMDTKGKKKELSDVRWSNKPTDEKYYLETSNRSPYCVFNYQVVVKFSDNLNLNFEWFLDIDFREDNQTKHQMTVSRLNKIHHKSSIAVFDTKKGKIKKISGKNLFLGLLIVDSYEQPYELMPMKLTHVTIRSPIKDEKAQVYLNFMSHYKYNTRRSMSGPASISWSTIPAVNTFSRTRRRIG